ncbi:hypothetical protein PsYK624_091910 [Phanerochaete sordida]|uniref:Uncharacterized protein n=1 Tax=Phanerochaete sordida TaxID=48140 RepID=A0A9P3GE16_9APHY|nr:hypothetical protein PsYK624_091910 [Phanerochaete sordida]
MPPTYAYAGRSIDDVSARAQSRGFDDTMMTTPLVPLMIPLALTAIGLVAIVILVVLYLRRRARRRASGETPRTLDRYVEIKTPTPQRPLPHTPHISVQPCLLISAPTRYTPLSDADAEDTTSPAKDDAKSEPGSKPASRAPSSLLDSSTSHMAVYDDPYGAPAPPTPPPMPPLPSHVLDAHALRDKYATMRQARRARRSVSRGSRREVREPGKRYATDGGVRLAGGRTSAGTVATVDSTRSQRSAETVQTSSTMPPPYAVYK